MKKDFDNILNKLQELHKEIDTLKKLAAKQNEEIEGLKKQLDSVTTVKIEEDGKQTVESYGNLILDEIISIKKKLEEAEITRGACGVAAFKNQLEGESEGDYSMSELKEELLKLAEMMTE